MVLNPINELQTDGEAMAPSVDPWLYANDVYTSLAYSRA